MTIIDENITVVGIQKKCGRSNYIKTAVKADRGPSDIRLHVKRCVVLRFQNSKKKKK